MKKLFATLLFALALPLATAGEPITVEVRGQGPDVILLPGLASSRGVWADASAALAQTHRLHLVQVAGFAGEPASEATRDAVVAPVVEAVHAYILKAGLRQPALVGHSLGGAAALALAARYPQDVGRVLVVDALPFFSLLFGASTAGQAAPQAAAFRDATLAMSADQFAAGQSSALQRLVKSEAHRPQALQWSLDSDRRTVALAVHEVMTTDLRPELVRIVVPVTVVYAADATGRSLALYSAAYQGLPGARLVGFEGASHFLMWDEPARFLQALRDFLA